jgi:predicted metal-dependent phosphoesterase TrpH
MERRGLKRLRVDLHVHTTYSEDCWVPLEAVLEAVLNSPIDAIAVTDHNEIEGALRLSDQAPFPIIVGEEIASLQGEIAGLFLSEWIPPGLSALETIARIKEQGGLVYVPHPLAWDVPSAVGRRNLEAIIDRVDIIEGFNARILRQADNLAAQEIARQYDLPIAAGSDAHFAREIGRAGVELEPFTGPEEFLHRLRAGTTFGRRTPYVYSLVTCGLWYVDKGRELVRKVRGSGHHGDRLSR